MCQPGTDAGLDQAACTRTARMASGGVARAVDPVFSDLDGDVEACMRVVRRYFDLNTSSKPSPRRSSPSRLEILEKMIGRSVGELSVTKHVGGELAEELSGINALFTSTDAIRNSGILSRMLKTGSWTWQNPGSNVLELAIAEQDAASLVAGAAAGGMYPLLFSMEAFYWRMLDQMRQSICFMELPVVCVGTSGGVGDLLGPMVQSDTCLVALNNMIGLEVYEAADSNSAKLLVAEALARGKPAYIRLPHEAAPQRATLEELASADLSEGFWNIYEDDDISAVVLCAGSMREHALIVAKTLNGRGYGCRVLEVFAPRRFADISVRRRGELLPQRAVVCTMHNAPTGILKECAPEGALLFGVDGYGICGRDVPEMYGALGLSPAVVAESVLRALEARAT
jgi:transketolase C-terminal domain/subunit